MHLRHRQVEHDQLRLQPARELDRLQRVRCLSDDVECVRSEERPERLPRERVVVDDQDPHRHGTAGLCRYGWTMRQEAERSDFEAFLWGEVILVALLGAALALFLSKPVLRNEYHLPELRLMLMTLYAVGGGLVALLSASRFAAEGRRFDLVLCGGFFTTSIAWAAFAVGPAVTGLPEHRTETWAGMVGILVGWALVAVAPFVRGRVENRRTALVDLLVGLTFVLFLIWAASRALGVGLPELEPAEGRNVPGLLTAALALLALV